MIVENMHHATDSMGHLVWHTNEEYAEYSPFSLDSLVVDEEAAALEEAWLSLRMHFEKMLDLDVA